MTTASVSARLRTKQTRPRRLQPHRAALDCLALTCTAARRAEPCSPPSLCLTKSFSARQRTTLFTLHRRHLNTTRSPLPSIPSLISPSSLFFSFLYPLHLVIRSALICISSALYHSIALGSSSCLLNKPCCCVSPTACPALCLALLFFFFAPLSLFFSLSVGNTLASPPPLSAPPRRRLCLSSYSSVGVLKAVSVGRHSS